MDSGIELSIITNGSMLSGKKAQILAKAKWVRISMDSMIPQTYAQNRGISENAIGILKNNIKEFAKMKDPYCELGINFVIGKENYK